MNNCLSFAIGSVMHTIMKFSFGVLVTRINLAHRKPDAIANVIRWCFTRTRRFSHENTNPANLDWVIGNAQQMAFGFGRIISAANENAHRKVLPHAWGIQSDVADIIDVRILNSIAHRKQSPPQNAKRIYFFWSSKLDHDPLRMNCVALAREYSIQIRIALPKAVCIVVIEPGIAVVVRLIDCVTASRQPIPV